MNKVLVALDRRYADDEPRIECASCGGMFPAAWQEFMNAQGLRICEAACKPSSECQCSCHRGNEVLVHAIRCCRQPGTSVIEMSQAVQAWAESAGPQSIAEYAAAVERAASNGPTPNVGKLVSPRRPKGARTVKATDLNMVEDDPVEDVAPGNEDPVSAVDGPAAEQPGPVQVVPPAAPAPPALTPEQEAKEAKFRRVVKLMGGLLIARRDVAAIEHNGTWMPHRENMRKNSSPLVKFRVEDFRIHMFGDVCLGTYLLDENNMVRFFAVDIDLKSDGAMFFPVRDPGELEALIEANPEQFIVEGVLESEQQIGNIEEALHRPEHPGHRWARMLLRDAIDRISGRVVEDLGLVPLAVLTGGGAHVLVPMPQLTPAVEARALARTLMEACHFTPTQGENFWGSKTETSGYTIEIFPKQDTIPKSGFGNLIRLPLGRHAATGFRTHFTNTVPIVGDTHWSLNKIDPLSTLEAAATALNLEL